MIVPQSDHAVGCNGGDLQEYEHVEEIPGEDQSVGPHCHHEQEDLGAEMATTETFRQEHRRSEKGQIHGKGQPGFERFHPQVDREGWPEPRRQDLRSGGAAHQGQEPPAGERDHPPQGSEGERHGEAAAEAVGKSKEKGHQERDCKEKDGAYHFSSLKSSIRRDPRRSWSCTA